MSVQFIVYRRYTMNIHPKHNEDPEAIAYMLGALSHPARIEILRHLSCHESCHCKDVVAHIGLAQSTVSQHLKVLVAAGLVIFRPEQQRSRYSVNREALQRMGQAMTSLIDHCCAGARRQTEEF